MNMFAACRVGDAFWRNPNGRAIQHKREEGLFSVVRGSRGCNKKRTPIS